MVLVPFDFAKAFDSVDPEIMCKKLEAMGVTGTLLNWLHSYFTDRKFLVKVGEHTSDVQSQHGSATGVCIGSIAIFSFYK